MIETQENEETSSREAPPSPVAGIDVINLSLRALWNHKSSATYKDLATPAGLHPTTVSQALSSARDIGLTESAGKRGLYTFTLEGKEYTRALTRGAESEAKERLKLVVLNNARWVGIIAFLRTNEGVPRLPMDLVIDVERKLSKQWSPGMRTNVASALVSILEYADLVKVESGKIVSLARQEDVESRPKVITRGNVRDPFFPMASDWPTATDLRRTADRMEPLRPEFAEFKDENVVIRVRKDLQSIAFAKSFLDFVETGVRLAQQNKNSALKGTADKPEGEASGEN